MSEFKPDRIVIEYQPGESCGGYMVDYIVVKLVCDVGAWHCEKVIAHDHWHRTIEDAVEAAQAEHGIPDSMTIDFRD